MANASSTLRGVASFTHGTELELLLRPKKFILDYLAKKKFNHSVQPGDSGASKEAIEENRDILMECMAGWLCEAGLPATSSTANVYDKINVKREPELEDRMHQEGDGSCKYSSFQSHPRLVAGPVLSSASNVACARSLTLRRGHGNRLSHPVH
jgi:hypothetical protein